MKATIFGTGYVGLVTGTCLAEVGNDVVCVDIDTTKIGLLAQGIIPIYELGLENRVRDNQNAGRLHFTTDVKQAVQHGLFQFIAMDTLQDKNSCADLQYVLNIAQSIAEYMQCYRIIINKSTVPTAADKIKGLVQATLDKNTQAIEFDVISHKEALAFANFMKPDRNIIGTDNPRTTELLKVLYAPYNRSREHSTGMDVRSGESAKYAATGHARH